MEPKLILVNGNPGMGKTTLAERYVEEHPLTLNLDIDNIWIMIGHWDRIRPETDRLKLKYAYSLAEMHLMEGHDVIVPSLMQTTDQYERFESIAKANNAVMREIVLSSNLDDAIERCKTRARSQGHPEGFRPGGVLDRGGRENMLAEMYNNVQSLIAERPNIIQINSIRNSPANTYQRLLTAIDS